MSLPLSSPDLQWNFSRLFELILCALPRTKWWKLKEDAVKTFKERVLKEGPLHEGGDANSMWMGMTTCIRKVTSEEFGVTKGGKRDAKETWWWNENVQKTIKEKK
jgi:hypothetical protein